MPKNSPLITVGITCFNAEDTIARAIESACKQNWSNFEIIVVDDHSTDHSVKIIESIQKKDKRVQLQRHSENRGYPSALNTIVEHAQGEYIAFFDDDDSNKTDRLTKQYVRLSQFQNKHPEALVLCYAHRHVFVDGGEKPDGFVNAIGAETPEPNGSMVADFLLWHKKTKGYAWGEFGSCTMMAPKAILREFAFDTNFRRSAEWYLAIRVALQGGYFIAVNEALVIQHKTKTPDKEGTKPLDYALMLREKHKSYLLKNHVYLGSILQAYSRFNYFRNNPWRSRMYLALACLVSPTKILKEEVHKISTLIH